MNAQASLFDPPPIRRKVQTAAEAWRERLRAALYARHRGERVTADHAVALMDADAALRRPPEVHRNTIGTLFQGWERAVPVMVGDGADRVQLRVRSPRDRNDIAVWLLR